MDDDSFIDMYEDESRLTLHTAAASGDIDAIRDLVAGGADVNALDSMGRSLIVHLFLGDA